MQRKYSLALACVSLLGAVLVAVRLSGRVGVSESALRPDSRASTGEEASQLDPEPRESATSERELARQGRVGVRPRDVTTVRVTGRTVAAEDGRPVRASVAIGGATTWADAESGDFFLELTPSGASITVAVDAAGFARASIEHEVDGLALDLGEIRLEADHVRTVLVVGPDGLGVAGAQVWRVPLADTSDKAAFHGPHGGKGETLVGMSDHAGVVSVRLVGELVILARLGQQVSPPQVWRVAADSIRIMLPEAPSPRLGLRDALGNPVAGAELFLRGLSHRPACAFQRVTGEDGLVSPNVPAGRYQVRLALDRFNFQGEPLASNAFRATADLAGTEDVWLRVEAGDARYIEVKDAETGARLQPLTVWLSYYRPDGPSDPAQPGPWRRVFAPEEWETSRVALQPFIREHQIENPSMYRLYVGSPGYQQGFVESPLETVTPSTTYELLLERLPRRTLRFVTTDGAPYEASVSIHEGNTWCARGRPDASGEVRFAWSGGDVVICVAESQIGNHIRLASVSRDALQDDVVVIVELETPAALVVEVPEGERVDHLVCFGEDGTSRVGVLCNAELAFEDLPPGKYGVGPIEMLRTLKVRLDSGADALPVDLLPGETRQIQWEDSWHFVDSVSGAVITTGIAPDQLWVVPRFAGPSMGMFNLSGSPQFEVGRDGRFEIDGITMAPTNLVFFRLDSEGESVPVGVGYPHVISRIECGTPSISIPDVEKGLDMDVTFRPRFPAPWGDTTDFRVRGLTGAPIDLGPVPLMASAHVDCGAVGLSRDIEITLLPGEDKIIEIDVESSSRSEHGERGR